MLDLKKLSFQHTDLQSTRITRDEADVKSRQERHASPHIRH